MSSLLSDKVIEAAGGVVESDASGKELIAVIYRDRHGGEWGLPKGKRKDGEPWQDAALREVEEEIKLKPVIVGIAGATAYLAEGQPKVVLYWQMRFEGEVPPFVANDEAKRLLWLPPEEAIDRLSHAEEANVVRMAYPHVCSRKSATSSRALRIADCMHRFLVPILRRRALKRLASEVGTFRLELKARSSRAQGGKALAAAEKAIDAGDIDTGWRYLQTARRIELVNKNSRELAVEATAIRKEAERKLNEWRKKAVAKALDGTPDLENIYAAAWLRDEHYNNEAYKDGLRRNNAGRLAVFLIIAILLMLWITREGFLQTTANEWSNLANLGAVLVSLATFGLLGAAISAIIKSPKADVSARIPELIYTFRISLLRMLMGPASAILMYFMLQSDFATAILKLNEKGGYTVLIIAFVAGFSERLVLRIAEAVDRKASE